MKIISGSLKGRTISGYNIEGIRPTMDRVKESLFAIINKYIKDSIVLDLFAGTGNLGIEAISNGASKCYFNDINLDSIRAIKENINSFKINDKSILINKDSFKCIEYLKNIDEKIDIIFLDPPYNKLILNDIIESILVNNILSDNGIIICEVSHNYLNDFESLNKMKEKKYGDKYIVIYGKKN